MSDTDPMDMPESLGASTPGPWPAAVGRAWAARLAAPSGPLGPPAPGAEVPLPGGWWLRGAALGGTALFDRDPARGHPRRWGEADRAGQLHAVASWEDAGSGAGRLRGVRLRLPGGGWLDWEPSGDRHPLWGASDRLSGAGVPFARVAAQPWNALRFIPPLDRPAALPPGAGEAALNWLAALAADQGVTALPYRGPYPTAHLFDALRRSFRPVVPESRPGSGPEPDAESEARTRFSRNELERALSGEMAESAVAWAPDPWVASRSAPDVLLRHRRGIETVWIGTTPFRAERPAPAQKAAPAREPASAQGQAGQPLPAGERLWREGPPGAARLCAGLVLLGEPFRTVLLLDEQGRILEDRRPEPLPGGQRPAPVAGLPLAPLWEEAVLAACALRAAPPLAPAVLALRGGLGLRWAALPFRLVEPVGAELWVQAELREQFRRLAARRSPAELALMLLSDVTSGALPHVLARAQAALEADPARGDAAALLRAGAVAQARAGETLAEAAPRLVRAIGAGKWSGYE